MKTGSRQMSAQETALLNRRVEECQNTVQRAAYARDLADQRVETLEFQTDLFDFVEFQPGSVPLIDIASGAKHIWLYGTWLYDPSTFEQDGFDFKEDAQGYNAGFAKRLRIAWAPHSSTVLQACALSRERTSCGRHQIDFLGKTPDGDITITVDGFLNQPPSRNDSDGRTPASIANSYLRGHIWTAAVGSMVAVVLRTFDIGPPTLAVVILALSWIGMVMELVSNLYSRAFPGTGKGR